MLKTLFPNAPYYDLLKSDEYTRLSLRPSLLREECDMLDEGDLVIIDEVQKIPALLDEVHWLMSARNLRFIMCGSSARKLRRCGANLLGGRAIRKALFPLVSREIPDFDIERALNNGMLPRHYLVKDAQKRLEAYVGDYLQQEIVAEAVVRRIDSFIRFLQVAALSDAEIINYTNIASDCGVSAKSVKASSEVSSSDTKGLRAFGEEHSDTRLIVVSMEARPRRHNGIEIWPAMDFLKRLWDGKFA